MTEPIIRDLMVELYFGLLLPTASVGTACMKKCGVVHKYPVSKYLYFRLLRGVTA